MKKKLGIGLLILVLLITGSTLGVCFYLIDYTLLPANEYKDQHRAMASMCDKYPHITPWLDSLQQHQALKDTFSTAPDGIRLHAYYAQASRPKRETAVIIHGYTDCALRMIHIGYLYNHSLDFNILLPDLRHSGLSEGDAIQMGWLDRKDIMQWIDVAPSLFGDSIQTVVHGISMGAATTMMVSGEQLPQYVKCFVEDCGYTSAWDQFAKELNGRFGLPIFPILYISNWLCDLKYGWDFKEASSVKQVAKCKLPMLFIHGDSDDFVPTDMIHEVFAAKPQPKEMWIPPHSAHAQSYSNHPEEYTRRVKEFVEKSFK